MPKVSVIVPTYNRAPLLVRSLRSVLSQTFADWEIVVVDDGSTDDTDQRVARFVEQTDVLRERLNYVRLPVNRGANAARNAGIARARGSLLAFLDSDDLWHPEKLARQLSAIEATGASGPFFSYTGRFRVDSAYDVIVRQLPSGDGLERERIRGANVVGTLSAVLIDAGVVRAVGGFDEALEACQDWDLFVRALDHCRVSAIREPLVMYYDGDIARVSRNSRRRFHAHMAMYRKHMRGRLSRAELAPFYRNLAEDLEGMGHLGLADRFDSLHHWLRGSYLRAVGTALRVPRRSILGERYANYARKEARRADKSTDEPYLRAYAALLREAQA